MRASRQRQAASGKLQDSTLSQYSNSRFLLPHNSQFTSLPLQKLNGLRHLKALNKYFWKYKLRLGVGIFFILISNYFGVLAPQVTGFIMDFVQRKLSTTGYQGNSGRDSYDILVQEFIRKVETSDYSLSSVVALCGGVILALALLRGFFMFLMRQTIIVMSRHIEYDQKNEVFRHYQQLDAAFFKRHSIGDLMSRMAEDVSRVRMFTGPAIMYLINLTALISMSIFFMWRRDPELTLYVLAPLPILALSIYMVNNIIHRKSESLQATLSDLTTNAQQSYSGIRVIKSFGQEDAMFRFFEANSEKYKKEAVGLAKVEALYFPSMTLLIGLSTLLTIMIGGFYYVEGHTDLNTIVEFVIYINMLTFPVSAIGWTASMIQRAAASQKRLNEFLHTEPVIRNGEGAVKPALEGNISFRDVNFIYPHTGIHAIRDFNLEIRAGEKVAVVGRTGSGKSTLAQLLLRMYDVQEGSIEVDGHDIRKIDLATLRESISYVPQDGFLFSDSISNNIAFGAKYFDTEKLKQMAELAVVRKDIESFPQQYETQIGERGVALSGGQKQRISIARALMKDAPVLVLDDCLSAVDARTEKEILSHLGTYLRTKTAILITHRIYNLLDFDKIIVLTDGSIAEEGRHEELLAKGGLYTRMYEQQQKEDRDANLAVDKT
jgi:ATP-binding cassette subfamily B multidrug efflux pump